jgi:hypothetical protein
LLSCAPLPASSVRGMPGGADVGWCARGVAKGKHHAAARKINEMPTVRSTDPSRSAELLE